MTQTPPPSSSNKLFIRSEVLTAIASLSAIDEPSKQDKAKQVKRLQSIEDQPTVQRVLLKELQRSGGGHPLRIITEMLMDLGDIELVQEPLWALIQAPTTTDEIKDAANLILRQLGDDTDPNLYLEYLDDPSGLITRETERMLEVSTRNPEALIDFIDFIFSLPPDEQCNLIRSLQSDYPAEYLLNIFLPALLANPPISVQELLLLTLGDLRSGRTALFLHENEEYFQNDPRLVKAWKKSVSALKIAGFYREERFDEFRRDLAQRHAITTQSTLYQCFSTIPDGIGNQGIIISRERENGDIVMMSVAVNDLHGIIDCFGFYELSRPDFHKLIDKFHEESSKIHAPKEYCLHKLLQAERLNRRSRFRIPYEYTCWRVLLDDVIKTDNATAIPEFPDLIIKCQEWAKTEWDQASANLYHHPDFSMWFLEEGDHPVVTTTMDEVLTVCARALSQAEESQSEEDLKLLEEGFEQALDELSELLVQRLLATEWRGILAARLADSAYLLQEQKAFTFSALAATEVGKLLNYTDENTVLDGFIRHYGRRCIEEDLLRLRQGTQKEVGPWNREIFDRLVEHVMTAWEL
jgi:hypothetical protein